MANEKNRINIFLKIFIIISTIVSLVIVGYISFIIYFGMNFANTTGGVTFMSTKLNGRMFSKITDSLNNENWKYNLPAEWENKLLKEDSHYNEGLWYYVDRTDTTKELVIQIRNYNAIFINTVYVDSTRFYRNALSDYKRREYENLLRETVLKDIEKEALSQGLPNSKIYLPKEWLIKYGYDDFAKEIYPD